MGKFLLKIDLWLLARLDRPASYILRYFTSGRHRALGVSTAAWIEASRT